MRKVICGLLLIAFALPCLAEQAAITKVEHTKSRGFDYLNVEATGDVKAKGLLLENQLIIEFPESKISTNIKIVKRQSKRFASITSQQDGSTAKIIINLKGQVDYDITNIFGRNKNVIEVSDRLGEAEKIMLAWEKENLALKAEKLESHKMAAPADQKSLPLVGKVIVIDPGHGGKDPGAFTLSGVAEKYLTLPTAQRIAKKLNAQGATVYLTRNSDRTVSIKDIADFANKVGADIFISVHFNYNSLKNARGTETYYYNKNSRNLALAIHRSLVYGLGRRDRGLRRAMYYTVHHAKMPAVLIEPLYISNWEEQKLAGSAEYQDKIAAYVAQGVKSYFRSQSR
ncbi:MAG: N-acetylmuramoyl-L-alanine amidase [bacterium]